MAFEMNVYSGENDRLSDDRSASIADSVGELFEPALPLSITKTRQSEASFGDGI